MIENAVRLLREGGVIVYPTDTVYGLGADAMNESAVKRIFEIKGRERGMAISVAVCDAEMAREYAELNELAERLFVHHMPGALTLVVKNKKLPGILTGGSGTIGIRMPADEIALGIIRGLGRPITATSANVHGRPPARSVDEAKAQLGDDVDLYVDGGERGGEPSTVYDCVSRRIIRQGSVVIENYL